MTGIVACGAWIPARRLPLPLLAGKAAREGAPERALAWADEDALTMAVEAARDCLGGRDRGDIELLLFASTTGPYAEKQGAAIIAAALGLAPGVRTVDVGSSLRGGTQALLLALDAVRAGSARAALVLVADCREGAPGSALEANGGDAAVAFLLAGGEPLIEVIDSASESAESVDVWRRHGDRFTHAWEERFVLAHGYLEPALAAAGRLGARGRFDPARCDHLLLSAPDRKAHEALARALGGASRAADPLLGSVGACGSAHALLQLVALAETAEPGASALLVNHGDGADALGLRFRRKAEARMTARLARRLPLTSPDQYRRARDLLVTEYAGNDFQGISATVHRRERAEDLALAGQRCACGHAQFPRERICGACGVADRFTDEVFAERRGRLLTYTLDAFFPTPEPPTAVGVVQVDDGPRIYLQLTDVPAADVALGMALEFTFRRIHTVGGRPNYFWKCRPRGEAA
ncbi:MAG: OB-fold domain-containing protein [Gammaproteobacteria bacterium]|jgi:hydroxymethylglutaryl-CoA synthase|nr:OB-fold domain-containing protein [Gammaproteobacteria bacterium]MBK8993938.1 OB-fold domain-containing protein [Gammaproteobacteria bacterium]MBP6481272.1 OB-fold domain-containing protein [Pseudomonadales bacterium]MBP7911446.1 OB-fold domain-containing protein [Pseudomonadales bacterium]